MTLSQVFSTLEARRVDESGGIEEYSYSQTTLEQVFISLAKRQFNDADGVGKSASR